MRITCPNCKATYEVGDADIPDEGIEVECSACLNRWMQMPFEQEADADIVTQEAEAAAPEVAEPSASEDAPAPEAPPVAPSPPEPDSVREVFAAAASVPEPEPAPAPEQQDTAPDVAEIEDVDLTEVSDAPVEASAPEPDTTTPWEEPVYDPAWEATDAPDLEAPSELNAPTDLEPLEAKTGWRVPKPPETAFLERDPLDEILEEVNAAASTPEEDAPFSEVETAAEQAEPSAPSDAVEEGSAPSAPEAAEDAMPSFAEEETPVVSTPSAPSAPEEEAASGPSAAPFAEDMPEVAPVSSETEVLEKFAAMPYEEPEVFAYETVSVAEEPEDNADALAEDKGEDHVSDIGGFAPEAEAEMPEELVAEPEMEPIPEPEPEPKAPHWSEVAATLAPVAAVAAAAKAVAEPKEEAPVVEDAAKDIEDFIRDRTEIAPMPPVEAPEAPLSSASTSDEEEIFHPWDGEVAPEIDGESEAVAEEDDFEWDEPPDVETPLSFNPEPDEDDPVVEAHIASIERQNREELQPEPPQASNVIQADIPQAPMATMPSGKARPAAARPSKPTPVESAEDVQAAIRAQLTSMKKPPGQPVKAPKREGKTGIFAKLKKPKPAAVPAAAVAPAKPVTPAKPEPANKIKDALADFGEDTAPRSGKRKGFILVMVLFVLALVTYLLGGVLSGLVPALEPYISGFTNMVDGLRAATQKLIGG